MQEEHELIAANSSSDKKQKGRFKKLAKKIQKAALAAANNNSISPNDNNSGVKVKTNGISSYKDIQECIKMGLKVSPVVLIRKYPSREACNYDLTLGELRDLLLSLLQDKPPPRLFEIKNRVCIRGVVCLHVLNFDDGEYSVKVSSARRNSPSAQSNEDEFELTAAFLPYRLLTSAASDILGSNSAPISAAPLVKDDPGSSTSASGAMSLQPYVLSPAIMGLWGYPMHPHDFNRALDSQGFRQKNLKRKLEDSNETQALGPIVGLKKGSLSSVGQGFVNWFMPTSINFFIETTRTVEAGDILNALDCHCFRPILSDLRKPLQADRPAGCVETVLSDFLHTFSSSSSEYDSLWPANASRSGYPLPVASVDCEMCATVTSEASLTRLSILDAEGCVVLDTLVKPSEPIVDYKTAYSGISEKDLADVTVTLEQARLAFLRLVSSETILIGHSLESDLLALRLSHRKNCVDTALLFPHPLGFPRRLKLRQLAKDFLQMQIQRGNNGHDSTEDARAALQLALLKADNGPLFGVCGRKGMADARIPLLEQVDMQSVSAAALFWQTSSRTTVSPAAAPLASVETSTTTEGPVESNDSAGPEDIKDSGQVGWKSGESLIPRYVMERCIGGGAIAPRSLGDCALTVAAACEFLSERRLQWQREDSSDDVTELRRKDFCHVTVQLGSNAGSQEKSADNTDSAAAGDKRGELATVVRQLRDSVSLGQGPGGGGERVVLIVTSQPGLGRLQQLLAMRQRCMTHPMSSLVWTQDRERELAEESKAVAMGHVSIQVI
eukprot:gene26750-35432_t